MRGVIFHIFYTTLARRLDRHAEKRAHARACVHDAIFTFEPTVALSQIDNTAFNSRLVRTMQWSTSTMCHMVSNLGRAAKPPLFTSHVDSHQVEEIEPCSIIQLNSILQSR